MRVEASRQSTESGHSNGLAVFNTGANNSSGNVLADLLLGRLSDYQESTKNVLHNIGSIPLSSTL